MIYTQLTDQGSYKMFSQVKIRVQLSDRHDSMWQYSHLFCLVIALEMLNVVVVGDVFKQPWASDLKVKFYNCYELFVPLM
jgi:hypothetical protein